MSDTAPKLSWTDFVHDLAGRFRAKAIESPLYLVGGAVRDAYFRRAITDVDIAVDGDAIALARRVADWLDADVFVMDHDRRVARVFTSWQGGKFRVDFASFRGGTLEEDLRDRDFTMNAMAADLLGDLEVLIDPLDGATDLRQKVLRRCSASSIADDPIRLLRAIRLSTQFNLRIHPDTATDIHAYVAELLQASGERIRDEFFKLLGLDRAARALRVLQHLGVLQLIIDPFDDPRYVGSKVVPRGGARQNGLSVVERMRAILKSISNQRTDNTAAAFDLGTLVIQLDRFRASLQAYIEREYGDGRRHSELLILAAMLYDRAETDIDALPARLRLSVAEGRKLASAIKNSRRIADHDNWTELDQHRFWYELGESGIDAVLLASAVYLGTRGGEFNQAEWLEQVEILTLLLDAYFNRNEIVVNPALLLDGNDIQKLCQIKSGPLVGDLLRALREAQVTGEVCTVSEARDYVLKRAETRADCA